MKNISFEYEASKKSYFYIIKIIRKSEPKCVLPNESFKFNN